MGGDDTGSFCKKAELVRRVVLTNCTDFVSECLFCVQLYHEQTITGSSKSPSFPAFTHLIAPAATQAASGLVPRQPLCLVCAKN